MGNRDLTPLPNLGNGIESNGHAFLRNLAGIKKDYDSLNGEINRIKAHPLYQLAERNPDPALNGILRHLPSLRDPIDSGRLNFHAEIPGFNSNRAYLGFKYNF